MQQEQTRKTKRAKCENHRGYLKRISRRLTSVFLMQGNKAFDGLISTRTRCLETLFVSYEKRVVKKKNSGRPQVRPTKQTGRWRLSFDRNLATKRDSNSNTTGMSPRFFGFRLRSSRRDRRWRETPHTSTLFFCRLNYTKRVYFERVVLENMASAAVMSPIQSSSVRTLLVWEYYLVLL